MRVVASKPLPALRAAARERVDAEAEVARLRYVTPGAAQQLVYAAKRGEAERLLYADTSPSPASYPMLSAEVGITAPTLRGVATVVLETAAAWLAAAAEIERLRLTAKAAIASATSESAISAAAAVDWPQP